MRKLLLTTLVVAVAVLAVASSAPTAAARSGESGAFVGSINAIRAAHGLGSLSVSGELASAAQSWAQHMANDGGIAHNPNLGSSVSANWVRLGENVGVGYDVSGLMDAFVGSPSHYRNIVQSDFNYVGVGSVWGGDGRLYTTHLFMTLAEAPAPPEPEPAPAPPQPDPAPAAPAPAALPSSVPIAPAAYRPTPALPEAPASAPVAPPALFAVPAQPDRVAAVLTALRAVD